MRCVPTSLDGKMGGVGWKYMMRSVVDVMNGLGGASLIMDPDGNLVGIAS
jgi:hypothetical protein